jgi:glycosyltransferase involved in cell wall biosynthesis
MKILLVAPFPPPVTGHSLASKALLDDLREQHEVTVVDLSAESRHDGTVTVRRTLSVATALQKIWSKSAVTDAVYLTISESMAGNLKDLAIYLLCLGRLSSMYIHLHGGSIKTQLFDRHPLLRRVNNIFIRRLAGVIVSGEWHVHVFAEVVHRARIHVVPNFADDRLFLGEQAIRDKFENIRPVRVLYLSMMAHEKGFNTLADAYLALRVPSRENVKIDFAGMFRSTAEERAFLHKIAGVEGMNYVGVVDDAQKAQLFSQAHVFCLPTAVLEGQPISILEAYASGCVVVTTGLGGAADIFKDDVNGFQIQPRSPESVAAVLDGITAAPGRLLPIALANSREARSRYTRAQFSARLKRILEGAVPQ